MNEVDYLDHNRAESLQFEEKPDIKPPDVEQLQDADINQTAGKNKHSWNAKKSANSWFAVGLGGDHDRTYSHDLLISICKNNKSICYQWLFVFSELKGGTHLGIV